MDRHQERAARIVNEITSLHPRVERVIEVLRKKLDRVDETLDELTIYASPDYWRLAAFTDGMIKVRLMIEQNFRYIETFGILATTRYLLELIIWFRLLDSGDTWYCFTYAKQILTDKRDHAKEHLAKVRNEILFFQELDRRERGESEAIIRKNLSGPRVKSLHAATLMISEDVDRSARRRFSLYSQDAKTRGFGYQAYLMERQVIPKLELEIERLQAIKKSAVEQMPPRAQKHKPWRWKEQAEAAEMSEQFNFVYAYTSRLLHATPTSITTNQKNLEMDEITMFLDFIYVSMLDGVELAEKLAGIQDPTAN